MEISFQVSKSYITLRPESSENIPILLQVADLCFSKQNCLSNPKMGSKQSVVVATQKCFFQKSGEINKTLMIFGAENSFLKKTLLGSNDN